MEEFMKFAATVCSGLAVTIPLVYQLIKYVQQTVRDKNWPQVVKMVIDLMSEVETKMESGEDKKAYVMAVIKASSDSIEYHLTASDYEKIGELIDSMCDMSKVLNAGTKAPVSEKT